MHNEYINIGVAGGITKSNRILLDLLNRKQKGPFTISEAIDMLGLPYAKTSHLLAYWAFKGWLTRVRNGLYITVPLGAINPAERKEDTWIVASRVFNPYYIGGWSACEHWGLTEQIFKDIIVFTSHMVRERKINIQDTLYIVKTVKEEKLFGTNIVWRGQTKVKVSDPSRTIADILDDPSIGGGLRHIADTVKQYFEGEYKDEDKLFDYIKRLNNKTIYKRLGYILEVLDLKFPNAINICLSNISKGYSYLDPTSSVKGRILRRWNLKVNATIKEQSK